MSSPPSQRWRRTDPGSTSAVFTDLAEIDERIESDRYAKPTSLKRTPITSRQRQRALPLES